MEAVTSRKKPRIAAISYKGLSRLVRSLLPDYADQAEITVIDKVFDEAAEIARSLVAQGKVDVLLSAGANGAYLKDTFGIPVVRVAVTGVDVMRAMLKARKMSHRIAVITYRQTNSELEEIKDLVNLDIEQRSYTTVDDAKETFRELAHRGFRVIVGSSLITEMAEREGLIGVLVYSRKSVRQTIEDAIEIGRIRLAEEQRAERMNTILEHLNEGVLAVDEQERILLLNPAMETFTGLAADEARGKCLRDLVPQLSLSDAVKRGRAALEKVEKLDKKTVVTNRIPIRSSGAVTGAVLTIQDAQAISRVDRNIRSRNRRTKFSAHYDFSRIIGDSPVIREARELCARYARTDATVLLTGQTGTGKELFAQGIHNGSRRGNTPFVAVNCAAIPDTLLESELFGYEEGAFTGSRRGGQTGLFELAHTGTIFLDEIAEMPVSLQTRLLRVLQEKAVLPLGGEPVPIDVRVIAATNRDLKEAIREGRFREDLYYRLNILHVNLPSLRERGDDVLLLARRLLEDKLPASDEPHDIDALVDSVAPHFRRYAWPGNVRELENVIERIAALYDTPEDLPDGDLTRRLRAIAPEVFVAAGSERGQPPEDADSLKEFVERTEYQRICGTVDECHGNISEAARRLQLSRTTLWRKLRRRHDEGDGEAIQSS